MAQIELAGITKRYPDGFLAVQDLSLDIGDGELLILVGPSGCGKSTALRMIAGLEEITSGDLLIEGQKVNDVPSKDRDIAMVFQSYALYPHMTVAENMGFSLRLARVRRADIDQRVRDAAELLDLEALLDRRPANLSGGQRQRVAMGRAIVRSPKAFLMDEPLSNLDAKLRVQMRASIAQLQHRLGTTMVYVTHDQTEAMTLGDRVAVMLDGRLQQVAPPDELYDAPANLFVAGFIGSPPMNLLAGRIEDSAVRTPIGALALGPAQLRSLEASAGLDGRVVVGIRPEDFEDAAILPAGADASVEVPIELTESLGSEIYAHFSYELPDIAEAALTAEGVDEAQPLVPSGVARLHPSSRATAGQPLRMSVDTSRLYLFRADDGAAIYGPKRALSEQRPEVAQAT